MSESAQQVWRELGKPEAAKPTPEQLLEFMRLCDDDDGLALAERMLQSSDDAHRCWLMGHDALQDEVTWLRRELAEALAKVLTTNPASSKLVVPGDDSPTPDVTAGVTGP